MVTFLIVAYISILLFHIGCSNSTAAEYIMKFTALGGMFFWLGGYRWLQ